MNRCNHLAVTGLLMAASWLGAVAPASNASAGPVIRAIEVRGNTVTPTETVLATIRSKVGQPFVREWIDGDIKLLYQLGQFADIRVERLSAAGGVKLVYHVTEKPTITAVRFEGNKKIKAKELEEEVSVRPFRPLSEQALADSVQKILALYAKKGYHLAEVDYALRPVAEGHEIVFEIKEHYKSAVRRIQFVGNHAFSDRELKKLLRTKEKGAFPFRSGKYREELLEQDVAHLMYHYLNHGYLRARVDTPRVDISKDRRHIFITYAVEEGKAYRISDVRVEGEILTTPEEMRARLKTKPKMLYTHSIVEEDLRMLTEWYGTEGYAYANIQPVPIPDDEAGTAEMVFSISKGKRVSIERITITGNTTTRDKVIRRELKIKEGDLFNRRLIEESRERLMQLGFFEEVRFAAPRGSRDDRANLQIEVKERPTGAFNLGAGFSTAESFFFTGSIQKQYFFGRGLSGQLSVEISKLRQQYIAQVTDPYFLDSGWILSVSSSRTIYRYPDYDRRAFGGSVSLGHRLFEHAAVNLGYQMEKVRATDFSFAVPELFRQNASGLTSGMEGTTIFTASTTWQDSTNRSNGGL
ncbi:MAG: outer membrane protein assembly factor BamA [Deltaproteobacteria bacterium]|nr:outer membrane protein assembly factor BamA [Deltaproteobacteria bacterium]